MALVAVGRPQVQTAADGAAALTADDVDSGGLGAPHTSRAHYMVGSAQHAAEQWSGNVGTFEVSTAVGATQVFDEVKISADVKPYEEARNLSSSGTTWLHVFDHARISWESRGRDLRAGFRTAARHRKAELAATDLAKRRKAARQDASPAATAAATPRDPGHDPQATSGTPSTLPPHTPPPDLPSDAPLDPPYDTRTSPTEEQVQAVVDSFPELEEDLKEFVKKIVRLEMQFIASRAPP